jgi:hypothetical protein
MAKKQVNVPKPAPTPAPKAAEDRKTEHTHADGRKEAYFGCGWRGW